MWCDFGLVDNIVSQIADIARSAMEARIFSNFRCQYQEKFEFGELEANHQ